MAIRVLKNQAMVQPVGVVKQEPVSADAESSQNIAT